jgi:hypothetical protein
VAGASVARAPRTACRHEASRGAAFAAREPSNNRRLLCWERGRDFVVGARTCPQTAADAADRRLAKDEGDGSRRSAAAVRLDQFAGVAALIAGGYNALSGIAALSDDDTLAAQAQEVLCGIDLTGWGWFWLLVGIVQLITGVLILQRNA